MSEFAMQLFIILLLAGIMMICAEIFIPGGVLGTLGVMSMIGAIFMAYYLWGAAKGSLAALLIILLMGISLGIWIVLFPHTRLGKALTVNRNLSDAHSSNEALRNLTGKTGKAVSDLRPGGIALIDGKRIDVVSEGGMIDKDGPVRVIKVEGSKVVVRLNQADPDQRIE